MSAGELTPCNPSVRAHEGMLGVCMACGILCVWVYACVHIGVRTSMTSTCSPCGLYSRKAGRELFAYLVSSKHGQSKYSLTA